MAHRVVELPCHRYGLAPPLEFGDDAIGNTALKRERSRLIAPRPTKEPPRSLDCGLDIVAEINDSGNERGLEFALVQDATGKTASEIYKMGDADRYLTAMIRARFYREKNKGANRNAVK